MCSFTGKGTRWVGTARELMLFEYFERSIKDTERNPKKLGCSWSLTDIVFSGQQASSTIKEPAYSRPICTILQVALVELLGSWATRPSAVVGHSSGEIAAAPKVTLWVPSRHEEGEVGMLAVGLDHKAAQDHISADPVAIDPDTNQGRKQARIFVTGPFADGIVAVKIDI
ncbi:hypothetical protein VMCG_06973 [Cytospora schulzeri]|uniref:Malonyl-CoA:ACP transacylase (MAT) domain-containing protein n=1 Tax=Cytospora schulzeri TaxID=448051 RepID=A0A423W3V9_9PEZI|nr:hypothetical protein VMCG_06973 [Valsa malicola]